MAARYRQGLPPAVAPIAEVRIERLPRYYATYAASAPRRGARLLRVLLEVLDLPGLVAVHERDLGRVRVAALLELKRYYTYM